jgi:hypothetical protein
MPPREPGRIFWLWTFIVGVFSPGKGKRRINSRMQELYQYARAVEERNSVLTSENSFLRRELGRVEGERNLFLVQDEMNAGIHEPGFASTNLLPSNKAEVASSFDTRHQALAKG